MSDEPATRSPVCDTCGQVPVRQPSCSVCGQTSTDPGPWGDESLVQIQERNGWEIEPMEFEACEDCFTIHVCPDCLHEGQCCLGDL